ncbi:MAG: hypothetical protein IPN01_29555 [Deltaproteobacteria bacterium]|nr:hypothetical protein [Deltaproteobacteria bacterium]
MISALLLLSLTDARADDPKWTLTVDPLTLAIGFAHLQVERAFGDRPRSTPPPAYASTTASSWT